MRHVSAEQHMPGFTVEPDELERQVNDGKHWKGRKRDANGRRVLK